MLAAVVIVALSYIVPVAAMWMTGLSSSAWETGSWADIAGMLGGPLLRVGLALGGMISGFGMFNALVMSYSRLPLAMAQDGMLPKVFGKLHPRSRAPWVTILVCATGWAMCLGLGFERLIIIDILLYGASLSLEFVALIVLRIREPELPRPFRVPGGMFGAVAVGIAPMLLLGFSVLRSQSEQVLGISVFWGKVVRMTKRKSKGAYMISSVAEMYGIHPQTLRLYEREGLLKPSRTEGNTRLYTDEDLQRLEFILSLARDLGVNISGIAIILQMRERMEEMQVQIHDFVKYIQEEVLSRATAAADPAKGAIVPVRRHIVAAPQVTKKK
jgi:DNA-binding transcriptional MerR regulator